jgi:hypothetical protein
VKRTLLPSQGVLAAIPPLAVAVAAAWLAATPPALLDSTMTVMNEGTKILGTLGLLIAALTFSPGDYLRRGWGLCAMCYVFLLGRDLSFVLWPAEPTSGAIVVGRALLIVLGNACIVAGTWTLARAWRVAGMAMTVSQTAARAATGVAVTLSLLIAGPVTVLDAYITLHGHAPDYVPDWSHAWTVFSDLGDLLALPVIGPVALTAFAVRGGSLRWPWTLLAISLTAWLAFDAILTVPELLHVGAAQFEPVAECARVLAGSSALAAGLAQRRAVHELDADGDAD